MCLGVDFIVLEITKFQIFKYKLDLIQALNGHNAKGSAKTVSKIFLRKLYWLEKNDHGCSKIFLLKLFCALKP